jgi:AraC family transcriptional regulator of adaptative response/methylated-DNA-[protein]-cysteine methyltransferase
MKHTGVNGIALSQAALDYQRIEKAIAFLGEHAAEQPSLALAARATHMSEYHFQRVFTRWAGISPKRFLQFLKVEHAKRQLLESKAVLEVSLESGLSSPGRLHDLFVSAEAVTPGEFKTRGVGIEISYGFHACRFGTCLLGITSRGVCWLSFLHNGDRRAAARELKAHWSGAKVCENRGVTTPIAAQIFEGTEARMDRPLGLKNRVCLRTDRLTETFWRLSNSSRPQPNSRCSTRLSNSRRACSGT